MKIFLALIGCVTNFSFLNAEAPLEDNITLVPIYWGKDVETAKNIFPGNSQQYSRIRQNVPPQKPLPKPSLWPKVLLGSWLAVGLAGITWIWVHWPIPKNVASKLPLVVLGYVMVLSGFYANVANQQETLSRQLQNSGHQMMQTGIQAIVSLCTQVFVDSLRQSFKSIINAE